MSFINLDKHKVKVFLTEVEKSMKGEVTIRVGEPHFQLTGGVQSLENELEISIFKVIK